MATPGTMNPSTYLKLPGPNPTSIPGTKIISSPIASPVASTTPRAGVSSLSALGVAPTVAEPATGVIKPPTSYVPPATPAVTTPPLTNPNYAIQTQGFQNAPAGTPVTQTVPVPTQPLFGSVASSLANLGGSVNPITQDAYARYQQTLKDITDLQNHQASVGSHMATSGIPLGEATGMQNALNQQYTGQLNALTQKLGSLSDIAGVGTTQQSAQGNILNAAGGLTKPEANFPFVFNPAEQSFAAPGVAGGGKEGLTYNPQTDAAKFADDVINHRVGYDTALASLGYAGNIAEGLLSSTITSKGGNVQQLKAQGGIQTTQETQKNQYQSALQQAAALGSQLTDLITQSGVNPSDVNRVNQLLQVIAKNTSDPRYQALASYITDIAATYAQVLTPSGADPTDYARTLANSLLTGTASGQSIVAQLQVLDQQAQAKINNLQTVQPTGSSGGSASAGGYNFKQDANGNWVPA